uniref:Gustatory receptor 28b n=2 Tax=Cacopsylla melanoneura TaxID=428564 RepID=A0A8D8QVB8_9HEMI
MLRLHFYLCDVCYSINEVYGMKILLIIGYDFLVITSILFKLTSNLLATTTSTTSSSSSSSTMGNTSYHVLAHIYMCSVKCFMLYLIVRTADAVTKEARKLLGISHKLQQKNDQANINLELQCFIQRLERHRISFTAYGFFPLDYTLLYTIIGATTTYWVILVQFQLSYNI